jgi:hypothetical protein
VFFYKDDGEENIPADSPIAVSLAKVIIEIDNLPASYEGNFLGVMNTKDETIQFIRFEEDEWLIDVPVSEDGFYSHSLHDENITTATVKAIVHRFLMMNLGNLYVTSNASDQHEKHS